MTVLYSNVPPLRLGSGNVTFQQYFTEKLSECDTLYIASGYASKNALNTIDSLIKHNGNCKTVIVLGMYCLEGFPEGIYNTASRLNTEWKNDGIGEIRAVPSMKYHGKVYGFYKNGQILASVVGSHNLSTVQIDANNRRQYEISVVIDDRETLLEIDKHLQHLIQSPVSVAIDALQNVRIINEENDKLRDIEGVEKLETGVIELYKSALTGISFDIPLKVPGIPGNSQDYMKSNINKCYAKGRLNSRTGVVTERGWWETEVIVAKTTTQDPNYPPEDIPFYVVTDDGYRFLAHASGDYKKNFESHNDLKILGYWLKGRLVAAGLVEPVDSPKEDLLNKADNGYDIYGQCKGVVTYQKLLRYGRTSLRFTKTTKQLADEDGLMRNVWMLSFLPERT